MYRTIDFVSDSYVADYYSATVVYHGFYTPGGPAITGGNLDTSKAQFKIGRQTIDVSGNTTAMKWATPVSATTPGAKYDQIWDNRISLNYI